MKQFLLFAATVLVTLGTISQAHAKKPNDQEFRRVIVTLKSGEKVDGYVHRGWHADNSLFKKENYSFKITKTPDDKEPIKYTADDVESIEYVEKTEANPDGVRWEAHNIASPGISNRYRTFHRLVCLNKAGQNATTYWWKTWTTERVGNIDRRVLKTIYGIRFHNDPDKIVYPYMFVNSVLMDKQYPGLKDFCKKWFKGPEGKVHKKEAKQNDAWMLDMYDAYLAEQTDK
ncbi:MAG: hypothetical protein IJ382_02460 [Flavobacteriales bacterium]|nr:hypothetical protein [Flavobacteriales bacterium]